MNPSRLDSRPPIATPNGFALPFAAIASLALTILLPPTSRPAFAASEPMANAMEFFETSVRPLLAKHCFECHSGQSKTLQASLRLDSRSGMLEGGDSGPSVVPGKPGESLLLDAIRWESWEMPPDGKLKPKEIAALTRWVEIGAPWPGEETPSRKATRKPAYDWQKAREHWAFKPVKRPVPPTVEDHSWCRNAIDAFVLARLEGATLTPSKEADRRTLLRRLSFDLLGIPPTPEEIERFLADNDPDAYERLIGRLLDSPRYGERWGRHWLDVARYSEGYGGFQDSQPLPNAWRYRDWVVRSLNRDLPYDAFLRQQVAGDLLDAAEAFLGSGFFALGPTYRSDGGDPDGVALAKAETLNDRVDTLSRGLLGLTVACSRCHDHKFDPIPQTDYYALAGIFENTAVREFPLVPASVVDAYNDHQKRIRELDQRLREETKRLAKEKRKPNAEESEAIANWRGELDKLRASLPAKYPFAHILTDTGSRDMPLAIRGNLLRPGAPVARRFLTVLSPTETPPFQSGSGRRELADALVDRGNPLTARVFVNRVWQWHFGKGLVRTPSNFGALGSPPTHPELLDWLAADFMDHGWSIKHLHRTILLSSTYRQSAAFDRRAFATDGENELVWRMNPRRLDAESLRDALLHVTGELDTSVGGPSDAKFSKSRRRTLYSSISRNGDRLEADRFLRLFDLPAPRETIAERPSSTVPQQFLFFLNSAFMRERATALVDRLQHEGISGDDERIARAYSLLYGRPPTTTEIEVARRYLDNAASSDHDATHQRWVRYAQVLLSANEFLHVR
ncbi:Planctomycete cytochrome C [Planctomycetes bacterium Pan216]|uniref:Planctomycete cytochrome C n=1 Tax=Kolteria novifilia TaxID=2527975 RepID=A0A518AXB9_9BACT|nr:Planctomycete cytochrome C [Planctomycetes bacterium Pan216]